MHSEPTPAEVSFLFDLEEEKEQSNQDASVVTFARLFEYVHRSSVDPLDFEVEKNLRKHQALRESYSALMQDRSIAYSGMAAAASSDEYPSRDLDGYSLFVVEDHGDYFIELVFDDADSEKAAQDAISDPDMVTFFSQKGDILSYELGPLVKGVRMIILDQSDEKDRELLNCLKSTTTSIFLTSSKK